VCEEERERERESEKEKKRKRARGGGIVRAKESALRRERSETMVRER